MTSLLERLDTVTANLHVAAHRLMAQHQLILHEERKMPKPEHLPRLYQQMEQRKHEYHLAMEALNRVNDEVFTQ